MKPRRASKPRRKPYRQKPIAIPMTGLRDQIALHMHAALKGVEAGDLDSFDALANIINMAGLAMVNDERLTREFKLVSGAAMALNDMGRLIEAGARPRDRLIAPVRVAVAAIDGALPRMDLARLYAAEKLAVATLREQRAVVSAIQEQKHGTDKTDDQPVA